ncbi:DUF3570 domain-containing protein [Flavitalea flava]
MKNKYLTLALLTASICASGQKSSDSLYKKQKISRTEIQVLFGYYTQNGNHSAITGGTGTELLHVYEPEFTLTHYPDSTHRLTLNAGVDVITSASMDNIDFVLSSASRLSARLHISPGYSWLLKKSRARISINSGLSVESAYLSIPAGISISHAAPAGSREWSAGLQCYFDDLRYGRLSIEQHFKPVGLIYPWELRDTSWFNNYRRSSYNLDLAFYQVINSRMQLALFPELVYQKGLLSTPYHRIYFNDPKNTERVERLPSERWKFPIAAQLNVFPGRKVIIRTYYRFYRDNFGITAHTLQWEIPIKVNPEFSLSPLLRLYTQTAATAFRPYREHDLKETWYTSDYDLSSFNSVKTGVTLRYGPQKSISPRYSFNALSLRYAYYRRTDGLAGHSLSLLLEMTRTGKGSLSENFK